jgi:hypothetical protein
VRARAWLGSSGIHQACGAHRQYVPRPVSNPEDLGKTAEEIAALMQSPEIYRYLRAPEQNDEAATRKKSRSSSGSGERGMKKKPDLRVIQNENFFDPLSPEPAPVM